MAQYTLTHSCGHTTTEQLYGKSDERERKIKYLKTVPCTACTRQQQIHTAQTSTADLPKLTGSEKQIAWATTIRADLLRTVAEERASFLALGKRQGASDAQLAEQMGMFDTCTTKLHQQTSASWWIDHRTTTARHLLKEML